MIRGVLLKAGAQANGDFITPEAVQQAAKALGVAGGKVTYNPETQSMEIELPGAVFPGRKIEVGHKQDVDKKVGVC